MASILDSLKSLGRRLVGAASQTTATIAEGASRAYASFSERIERQNWQVRQQRGWLPATGQGGRNQRHLAGERAFSVMYRGAGGIGWPGANISDRAKQVLYFRRWVYVAAERIGDKIASLPPRLGLVHQAGQHIGEGAPVNKAYRSDLVCKSHAARWKRYQKSLHAIKPHEEVEEVGPDHPLYRILMRPNAWEPSAGQLWKEVVLFLLITGNAFFWVVPDRAFGMPLELWVIPSQWVFGPKLNAAGFESYRIMPYVGGSFEIPADEIIHLKLKSLLSKIDGFAALQAGAEWVDVAESIDQSRYWQFKNGTQATGALELDPNYNDPDDTDIDAIGAKFLARYQGERNAGVPIVLPPGVKMVPLTISPAEMSYEGGFEQMRDSVLALFGVPKEVAGIVDAGSHTAMWGPLAQFAEHAIVPKLKYIGEVLTATLCKRWDDHLRLWWDDPTPHDPAQQNADVNMKLTQGVCSRNEARAEFGMEPIDDPMADELLVNPNLIPLSMLREQIEQQQKQQQMMAEAKMEAAKNPQIPPGQEGGGVQSRQGRNKDEDDNEQWMAPNRPMPWKDGGGGGKPAWSKSFGSNGNGHGGNGVATAPHLVTHNRIAKSAPDGRITRDDFGFASPPDGLHVPQFAQCETCHKFTGRSCLEFAPSEEIIAGGACDLYVYGTPIGTAGIGHESGGTTPEESGYVERQVRCENCARANEDVTRCGFYEEMNEKNPKRFSLNTVISSQSCCNANTPKKNNG